MSERTYIPTGTGLCADCGHDVGRHIGGHKFVQQRSRVVKTGEILVADRCRVLVNGLLDLEHCRLPASHPIHDVGRVLLCPEEVAHD